METGSTGRRRLRRARTATSLAFLLFGTALGVWTARIPAIKEKLGLSDGGLTFVLLSFAAGCILGLALLGRASDRVGSSRLLVVAAVAEGVLLAAAGFTGSPAWLCGAVFLFGAAHGTLNIAMNANAVEVQRAWGAPIMSSFHAIYSIGGFAGALIGGRFAHEGVSVGTTFLVSGAGVLLLAGWVAAWVLPSRMTGPPAETESGAGGPSGGRSLLVFYFGVLVLCTLVGEGAAADWSAVYLRDDLLSTAGFAAYGYAAFSIMMTVGRVFGDRLVARLGPVTLVRAGGIVAAAGLGVGLLLDRPVAAVTGFGLLGLGLSCIAPQVFSIVGSRDAQRSGRDLSTVVSIGYVGFLVGPILIGAAATVVGLSAALWIPVILAALVAASGGVMRRSARPTERTAARADSPPGS
ncbi:MFS transporter [Actinoplanes sp. NBRC 101535]|uniref:MFS transporter n=1 Tax=Actinoplanes sp. NBRC 101535 TaxID=3032196 RepID=UPI0024A0113B|nr:MFS transporter [Actinoplanes sp. NBRC 101535]GLY07035.1 MFS transporter [Actinoplanes sp. NBRC 101535]